MDGFALRASDAARAGAQLLVTGEVRAAPGSPPEVTPGTTVRIMTGGALPPGADAIAPIEIVEASEDSITVTEPVEPGAHVRPAGEDIRAGQVAVPEGTELDAGAIALLASLGLAEIDVIRPPRVALLVTGDELVDVTDDVGPGQIRDSNSLALEALVAEAGGVTEGSRRVPDDLDAARALFEAAAANADLIVSSGGVSVGRYDLVREIVEELGATDFWRVAMKPGKPVLAGRVGDVPFLGLPGNPVSVHVSFEQFVRPAIRKQRGYRELFRPTIEARLTTGLRHAPGRLELVRVRLSRADDGWLATPTGRQGSHIQTSLLDTHGLARVPREAGDLDTGHTVVVEVWRLPAKV
jgi:molybdopterin molybdotransferase